MGRHNGLEFKLLCEVVYGVSMYEAQLAVVLSDDDAWAAIPRLPADETLRCAGRLVTLVSSVSGTRTAVRHLDEISELESVARLSLEASEPGEQVQRTIDLNTCAGAVILYTPIVLSSSGTTEPSARCSPQCSRLSRRGSRGMVVDRKRSGCASRLRRRCALFAT